MAINYLGVLVGLCLLTYGANLFIDGAAKIARYLGMPPMLIGLTIVGIATSAPEILVGVIAALNGQTEIAIGNAIGSNIANIGLVLGITAIIIPITITSHTIKKEFTLMMLAIVLASVLMLDQALSRNDAAVLLLSTVLVIITITYIAKTTNKTDTIALDTQQKQVTINKPILLFIIGLVLLLSGANILVECASTIARHYQISDLVIGLTIIAIGTSLPELAASIIAVKKNQADIAIGNIIGSNIFNMLAVIGIPSMIHTTNLERIILIRDLPVMIGYSVLLGWTIFIHGRKQINRIEGWLLLFIFIAYQYWLFQS